MCYMYICACVVCFLLSRVYVCNSGQQPWCGRGFETVTQISLHVVPRKHFSESLVILKHRDSELLENLEEMFTWYYMQSNLLNVMGLFCI